MDPTYMKLILERVPIFLCFNSEVIETNDYIHNVQLFTKYIIKLVQTRIERDKSEILKFSLY